jgi:hypothetical protein
MKRFAFVVLLVAAAAGAAAQANTSRGWHRCQRLGSYGLASLCDGRGHVLFPQLFERSSSGGYTQVVTGFHRTSSRRAFVDTYLDWGVIEGECGQNGVIRDCKDWVANEHVRYRTIDGGRHWLPLHFHRIVTKAESPGPDPPVQTGRVDDHPLLEPCKWRHAYRGELVDWVFSQFGNWCAPVEEWKIPDSLWP